MSLTGCADITRLGDMGVPPNGEIRDAFVSYASRDRSRVMEIVVELERSGLKLWLDRREIRENYGPEIVRGIRNSKVLLLMCSDASLRSRNVKQEIQLAWKYGVPYLPLLIAPTSFPEQVEYWIEGWQWVEVYDRPSAAWMDDVAKAMVHFGNGRSPECPTVRNRTEPSLAGLRAIARLTDQIWPIPATSSPRGHRRLATRDLGAPQHEAQHSFPLGSQLRLAVELEQGGYLTLLDRGTSGRLYCLCPSVFAPDTKLLPGLTIFPQPASPYGSFSVTGAPGREELIAIVTAEPLPLNWMLGSASAPARLLDAADTDRLLGLLKTRPEDAWTAYSTFFQITRQPRSDS